MTGSLVLASRSPRRRELLREAGIPFTVIDTDVDESVAPELAPEQVVRELAGRKAKAGAERLDRGWVLGADTVVAVGGRILGKPRDRTHSREMIAALSGTTHRVLSGVCLLNAEDGRVLAGVEATAVTMRRLRDEEIDAYVASGEGDDKAGAYAIQETGDRFVTRVEGSWSNVVGLPMELLGRLLREAGLRT